MRKPLIQTDQVRKGQARNCGTVGSGGIGGFEIWRVDCMIRCSSLIIDLDALIQVCKAAPYSGLDFGAVNSGRFSDMITSCLRTLSVECWIRLKAGAWTGRSSMYSSSSLAHLVIFVFNCWNESTLEYLWLIDLLHNSTTWPFNCACLAMKQLNARRSSIPINNSQIQFRNSVLSIPVAS